jgi:hypothetical protein
MRKDTLKSSVHQHDLRSTCLPRNRLALLCLRNSLIFCHHWMMFCITNYGVRVRKRVCERESERAPVRAQLLTTPGARERGREVEREREREIACARVSVCVFDCVCVCACMSRHDRRRLTIWTLPSFPPPPFPPFSLARTRHSSTTTESSTKYNRTTQLRWRSI